MIFRSLTYRLYVISHDDYGIVSFLVLLSSLVIRSAVPLDITSGCRSHSRKRSAWQVTNHMAWASAALVIPIFHTVQEQLHPDALDQSRPCAPQST